MSKETKALINVQALAQWGSDPNSGQGLRAGQHGITDLGSDPDWAGRDTTRPLALTTTLAKGAA